MAVDINFSASQVYWSDLDTNSIYRTTINANLVETVVQNAGLCEGIAVDWTSDLLFWTNSYNKRIEVSHLDGTDRCIIIKNGLDKPRAIVADPKSRYRIEGEGEGKRREEEGKGERMGREGERRR